MQPLLTAFAANRRMAAIAVLSAWFAIPEVHAATRYWSANGSTAGGDGIWNTTTNRWASDSGGPWNLAWNNSGNDIAENSSATANITLGANVTLGGFTQKAGGGSTSNSIEQGSGPYTLTLGVSGDNIFRAAANATTGRSLIINAAITGASNKHLVLAGPTDSGTGTITLGRANTFSGNTTFSAGATGGARVYLNNRFALQNSTVILSADANLIFDSGVSANAFTFGGLASNTAGTGSNLALRNDANTPIALTVGGNHGSTTYKGVLSGGGSLIKTGSGNLILTAANTHTGSTTVSAGTLQVDGSTTSPTTVASGATLTGSGSVNAAVTINSGGTMAVGDDNLTVSSLAFGGTATIHAGDLSNYTNSAAIVVTNALTVGGGAGAVTIHLPTDPGFNGRYHLIRFASGPPDASGFSLGTVPSLAWNQTGTLEINGNHLDYVISAAGDTIPPSLTGTSPANNAINVSAGSAIVATFGETIVAGSGNIELRRVSDAALVESFNVTSSPRLAFSTNRLTIQPTLPLPSGQTYYILIPSGAIRDTSGNNYPGITVNTGWRFTVPAPTVLYTDTGSPVNPPWSQILPTLNDGSSDNGPVYGSVINVNNAAVETGLYGNRPIQVPSQRIHVACHTSTTNFAAFTRWFQTDGNTHVLRVFVDDENTATNREGTSSHTEAFMGGGWNYTDNMTYEWTARYTIARLEQGYCAFQLKNSDNDWAVQLGMGSNGTLTINNRTGTDTVVTNPDGSAKNFDGRGFDVRVLDDGLNYKVWIDGVLYADRSYSRPTGTSTFRWGMYFGADNLNPPADYNLVLVSGAQIKSWPGNLTAATTAVTKENNSTNLNNGASWIGGNVPGLHNQALWNNTVTTTNSTTLAAYQQWAGLKIVNPGGNVTINGSSLLALDDSGVDMATATRNLTVNCPLQLTNPNTWTVASGRTATFSGVIGGYPGITLNGAGSVQLNAANTYLGGTTVSAGTLITNNNSALGTGDLILGGGNLSNTASCTLANDVTLGSNASVSVGASQTLTLNGSITGSGSLTKTGSGTLTLSGENIYTGATIVNAGTLAVGRTSALFHSPGLTMSGGTLLQPLVDGLIIRAPVTLGGSGTTTTISAPTNNPGGGIVSALTLRSVLSGSGNVTFSGSVAQNALSTVYLGAQSTYLGDTLINTTAPTDGTTSGEQQIIVKLGTHNALPPTTVLTIDGGNGSGTGRYAELNLNGFSQQLAGLTNITRSGAKAVLRKQRVVNSDAAPFATLTIHNSSNIAFSGNLGSDTANGSVSAASTPGSTNGNNFGLTKSGTGTFTLSSTNSYSGPTTVSQGTLSLAHSNPSNDSSAVTIAQTGATLHLAFTGTDTVSKLFVGSMPQPAGTYGAVGSPSPVIGIPQITGTGTLTVTSSDAVLPPGYGTWKTEHAPSGTPADDHDNDGVPNAIEYILGGTGATNDLAKLPTATTSGGNLIFTFVRDQASIDGSTALTIEVGENLSSWPVSHPVPATAVSNSPGFTVLKNTPVAGKDTVTLVVPLTVSAKFARLKVIP